MNNRSIVTQRLVNQHIPATTFKKPAEIVKHLVAMQSQEYAMAKWAIGLRVPGIDDAVVEEAFNKGDIIRTHLLRPTWHFVAPGDLRWLLALTAPRVQAFNAYWYKKAGLDAKTFTRANKVIEKILEGGVQLDRHAIKAALEKAKIDTSDVRLIHILMNAELESLICSGARQGKQFTYALLDERVPAQKGQLKEDELLARLTERYFTTRGPATVQDYSWWSGLSAKDAARGISMLPADFEREKQGSSELIFLPSEAGPVSLRQSTFLLPDYDEFGISYKDRSAFINNPANPSKNPRNNIIFSHLVIVNGLMGGTWQRKVKGSRITVEVSPAFAWSKTQAAAVEKAVKDYLAFFNS